MALCKPYAIFYKELEHHKFGVCGDSEINPSRILQEDSTEM
jgi:hypothetical protein